MKDFFTAFKKAVLPKLTPILFWGGLVTLLLGSIHNFEFTIYNYKFTWIDDFLTKSGAAILGAGVFSAIMKSAQFTDVFQKHILEALYNPKNISGNAELLGKWELLTTQILKDILPETHLDATNQIKEQFFTEELEYHFNDYNAEYVIDIDDQNHIATITTNVSAYIAISPNAANPALKQSTHTQGNLELISLFINGDPCNDSKYRKSDDDIELNLLEIPLKKYANYGKDNQQKDIKYERSVRFKQNLKNDPILNIRLTRYVKGATFIIDLRSDIYKATFTSGMVESNIGNTCTYISENKERWKVADSDQLILPGQDCLIAIALK